MPLAFNVLNV